MKRIKLGWLLILLTLTGLWSLADTLIPVPLTYFSFRTVLVQFTGVIAIGVMSVAMLLAIRPKWLEPHLHGLDKMYRLHKWLGTTALVAAVIQSATLGLEPDGALGEAYLVPYGGKVQFQAGYKGMMKLARQSGAVGAIGANVVRKRDVFEYTEGPEGTLRHVPFALDIPDEADDLALKEGAEDLAKIAGPLTHAYAWAKLKDGTIQRVVLNRIQVLARREKSSGWQAYRAKKISDNPWATSPAAMWQKTAIRELMKLCPQSVELARALKLDAAAESGAPQDFGDVIESTATEGDAPAPPRTTGDLLEGGAA